MWIYWGWVSPNHGKKIERKKTSEKRSPRPEKRPTGNKTEKSSPEIRPPPSSRIFAPEKRSPREKSYRKKYPHIHIFRFTVKSRCLVFNFHGPCHISPVVTHFPLNVYLGSFHIRRHHSWERGRGVGGQSQWWKLMNRVVGGRLYKYCHFLAAIILNMFL